MKFFALIGLLGLLKFNCYGQNQIGIYFNQNYSTFRFVDSEGAKIDLSSSVLMGYGISYQHDFSNNIFVRPTLNYENKGANSTYNDTHLDWSLHYAGIGIDGGYQFSLGQLKPYGGLGIYSHYLLKGNQIIGDKYYNLLDDDNLKRFDFGLNLFAGTSYQYSRNGSVFIELRESLGLQELEKESNEQKMFNRMFSVRIGLNFTINR